MEPFLTRIGDVTIERILPKSKEASQSSHPQASDEDVPDIIPVDDEEENMDLEELLPSAETELPSTPPLLPPLPPIPILPPNSSPIPSHDITPPSFVSTVENLNLEKSFDVLEQSKETEDSIIAGPSIAESLKEFEDSIAVDSELSSKKMDIESCDATPEIRPAYEELVAGIPPEFLHKSPEPKTPPVLSTKSDEANVEEIQHWCINDNETVAEPSNDIPPLDKDEDLDADEEDEEEDVDDEEDEAEDEEVDGDEAEGDVEDNAGEDEGKEEEREGDKDKSDSTGDKNGNKRKKKSADSDGNRRKKKKKKIAKEGEDNKASESEGEDKDGKGDNKTSMERKLSNMRRNIREVMNENELDEETKAAQRQELERLRRVQEQQRIIREVQRQIMLNKQKPKVISLLQSSSSLLRQCTVTTTSGSSGSTSTPSSSSGSGCSANTQVRIPSSVLMKLAAAGGPANKKVIELLTSKKRSLPRPSQGQGSSQQTSLSITPGGASVSLLQAKQSLMKEEIISGSEEEEDDDYAMFSDTDEVQVTVTAGKDGGVKVVEPGSSKPKGKELVTISSSSEDDCILLSDSGDESEPEDPSNSGMHTNDMYNMPDEQGRVLINVGHPKEEQDVFLAPQISRVIKPHQIGGLRFLFDNLVESLERFNTSPGFGCILAHSMGLGKTLQVVAFCDIFLRHTSARTVLCIMPINTLQNWMAEFNIWMPADPQSTPLAAHGEVRPRDFPLHVLNDSHKSLSARTKVIREWNTNGGVLLIGYELYRQLSLRRHHLGRKKRNKRLADLIDEEDDYSKALWDEVNEALVKPGPDLVICDEGHRIKNSHASISLALKNIRSKRRVVLTGYPLQNNLLEYWCMVDFVRPNYLGTKTEFCNMFERPIQNGQCIDSTPQDIRLMRYRAHVLHSLLEGFVQRRSHSVLQVSLPQKEEYVLLLRMTDFQRQLYDRFMNDVVRTKAVPNPLKAFAVCCKIWNHPDVLYYFLKKRTEDYDLDLEDPTASNEAKKKLAGKAAVKGRPRLNAANKKPSPIKPAASINPTHNPIKPGTPTKTETSSSSSKDSYPNPSQPQTPGSSNMYPNYPNNYLNSQQAPYDQQTGINSTPDSQAPQQGQYNHNQYQDYYNYNQQGPYYNEQYPSNNAQGYYPGQNYNQQQQPQQQQQSHHQTHHQQQQQQQYWPQQQQQQQQQTGSYNQSNNPQSGYPVQHQNQYCPAPSQNPAQQNYYGNDPQYSGMKTEGQNNYSRNNDGYNFPMPNYNQYPQQNATQDVLFGQQASNSSYPMSGVQEGSQNPPSTSSQNLDVKDEKSDIAVTKQDEVTTIVTPPPKIPTESNLKTEESLNENKQELSSMLKEDSGVDVQKDTISEVVKDDVVDKLLESKVEKLESEEAKSEGAKTESTESKDTQESLPGSSKLPTSSDATDLPADGIKIPVKIGDGKSLLEMGTNAYKAGREEPSIPYDWATELLKSYEPGHLESCAKMEVFFCILEESIALGDRMLVFSQSLFTLNLIEDFLQRTNLPGSEEKWARNANYYRLDGSTSALEREKLINEYNLNPNIHLFLVSTRAGSLGINLVGANRVIVFDASWNPCHDTQAVCRVYRYGQRKPCFVYRLVMDNCLEKKIYDRQINKQGMADRVVDELNPDAHLSIKEVSNLLWDTEPDTEPQDYSGIKDKYRDSVLQKVLDKLSKKFSKEPFQHESLLVDRKDKKLSQAEKRLAKRSYELEKQASINYNRPMYATYYPTTPGSGASTSAVAGPGLQIRYRPIRSDGNMGSKPVASVRPMQAELASHLDKGAGSSGHRGAVANQAARSRWIPAEVWQRQGMSAQEMTLPLDVVIPTNSPDRASIVLKAGQRVMVLKSPKGIYMQLENGKIIAIRTAPKLNPPKTGSGEVAKSSAASIIAGAQDKKLELGEIKNPVNTGIAEQRKGPAQKISSVFPLKSNSNITIIPRGPTNSSALTANKSPVAHGLASVSPSLKPFVEPSSTGAAGSSSWRGDQRFPITPTKSHSSRVSPAITQPRSGSTKPFYQQEVRRNSATIAPEMKEVSMFEPLATPEQFNTPSGSSSNYPSNFSSQFSTEHSDITYSSSRGSFPFDKTGKSYMSSSSQNPTNPVQSQHSSVPPPSAQHQQISPHPSVSHQSTLQHQLGGQAQPSSHHQSGVQAQPSSHHQPGAQAQPSSHHQSGVQAQTSSHHQSGVQAQPSSHHQSGVQQQSTTLHQAGVQGQPASLLQSGIQAQSTSHHQSGVQHQSASQGAQSSSKHSVQALQSFDQHSNQPPLEHSHLSKQQHSAVQSDHSPPTMSHHQSHGHHTSIQQSTTHLSSSSNQSSSHHSSLQSNSQQDSSMQRPVKQQSSHSHPIQQQVHNLQQSSHHQSSRPPSHLAPILSSNPSSLSSMTHKSSLQSLQDQMQSLPLQHQSPLQPLLQSPMQTLPPSNIPTHSSHGEQKSHDSRMKYSDHKSGNKNDHIPPIDVATPSKSKSKSKSRSKNQTTPQSGNVDPYEFQDDPTSKTHQSKSSYYQDSSNKPCEKPDELNFPHFNEFYGSQQYGTGYYPNQQYPAEKSSSRKKESESRKNQETAKSSSEYPTSSSYPSSTTYSSAPASSSTTSNPTQNSSSTTASFGTSGGGIVTAQSGYSDPMAYAQCQYGISSPGANYLHRGTGSPYPSSYAYNSQFTDPTSAMYSAFHRPEPHFGPTGELTTFLPPTPNPLTHPFSLPHSPSPFPSTPAQTSPYYPQNVYGSSPPYGRSTYPPPPVDPYHHPYTPASFNPFLVPTPPAHYPLPATQNTNTSSTPSSEGQSQ